MANSLEFKISADDQASRVVETVQKKIENFGRDIAKMALGIAGPAALVSTLFSKISDSIDEANKKSAEARDIGATGAYEELKLREQITKKAIEAYEVILAQKKIEDEKKAKIEMSDIGKREAAKVEFTKNDPYATLPYADQIASVFARIPKYQKEILKNEQETTKELNDQVQAREQQRINLGLSQERWAALLQSIKEYDNTLSIAERSRRNELTYVERIKKAQSELLDLATKQSQINLYGGSSQAQAGGGFANEQATLAASQERMMLAQAEASRVQEQLAQQNIQIANQLYTAATTLNYSVTNFSKVVTQMPSATSDMNLNVGGSTFDINSTF